jgi:hypothetical protein
VNPVDEGKNPGGRPTKYKEEYAEQAYKLCLLGATDKELANFFEVEEKTVNNWKEQFPKFLQSIKQGKEAADANVADRLYQRAMGYEHDDVELKVVSLGQNMGSEVQEVQVKKYYPPDPTSAIFWLKNRQKDKWRDRQEISATVQPLPAPVDYSLLSDAELQQLEQLMAKAATKALPPG